MLNITLPTETTMVFGHPKHFDKLEWCQEHGYITEQEAKTLIKWAERIFSGRYMDEDLSKKGHELNQKVWHHLVSNNKINRDEAIVDAIDKALTEKFIDEYPDFYPQHSIYGLKQGNNKFQFINPKSNEWEDDEWIIV